MIFLNVESETRQNTIVKARVRWWLPGGGGAERGLRKHTCNQQVIMSWRPNAQHSDDSQQHCVIKFKVAKGLDLNCSYHKKNANFVM